jgi:hypothetical protein
MARPPFVTRAIFFAPYPFTFARDPVDQVLVSYAAYYNQARTHLALKKDAPLCRQIQRSGRIVTIPILSGLHHQYVRM